MIPEDHELDQAVDVEGPAPTAQNPDPVTLPKHYLMQYFEYSHLPPYLQTVSRPFKEFAEVINALPTNPESSTAMRKLLEAKDCAVRSILFKG